MCSALLTLGLGLPTLLSFANWLTFGLLIEPYIRTLAGEKDRDSLQWASSGLRACFLFQSASEALFLSAAATLCSRCSSLQVSNLWRTTSLCSFTDTSTIQQHLVLRGLGFCSRSLFPKFGHFKHSNIFPLLEPSRSYCFLQLLIESIKCDTLAFYICLVTYSDG